MKKIIIFVSLMLLLFAVINVYSQEPSPTPLKISNKPESYTDCKNQAPPKNHSISGVNTIKIDGNINTEKSKEQAQNSAAQSNNKTSSDWRIIVFTGVLAIVAVLQFFAMVFQYCVMNKQDSTARLRDRAYVYFGNPTVISYPPNKPEVGGINIIAENVGNMPARIISIRCGWIGSPASTIISDPFPLVKWSDVNAPKFIGPKQSLALQGGGISIDIIGQAQKSEVNIFISMEVKYLDGFDLNKVRVTQMSRSWRNLVHSEAPGRA